MATLIYYDEAAHQAAQQQAADVAARFTDVLALYQALNLPAATTADLPALLADPASWLLGKYTEGQVFQVGGLTLDPAKVLELMVRPAGFDEFVTAASWLSHDLGVRSYSPPPVKQPEMIGRVVHQGYPEAAAGRPAPSWGHWQIKRVENYIVVGGRQVQLAKEGAAKLESLFRGFATTAYQKKLLAALQTVCAGLNQLPDGALTLGGELLGGTKLSEALIVAQYAQPPVRPNPNFILQFTH